MLVGTLNQEKALVGAFSMIVKTSAALHGTHRCGPWTYLEPTDKRPWPLPIFIYPTPEWA